MRAPQQGPGQRSKAPGSAQLAPLPFQGLLNPISKRSGVPSAFKRFWRLPSKMPFQKGSTPRPSIRSGCCVDKFRIGQLPVYSRKLLQ